MLHSVLSFIDTMAFSQVNYESLYLRKFSTFSNQSSVSQVKYNRLCTPVLYCESGEQQDPDEWDGHLRGRGGGAGGHRDKIGLEYTANKTWEKRSYPSILMFYIFMILSELRYESYLINKTCFIYLNPTQLNACHSPIQKYINIVWGW